MIVIVGATGTLGRELTRRLLARGERVVAVTRDGARARAVVPSGVEVRVADLTDAASLAPAVRGAHTVVAAAHSILGRGRYRSSSVDDAGHRHLIDAARAEGAARFVYTSVAGVTADHPVAFWRRKHATERYLEASGLRHTILRPAAFMETHAHELLGKQILAGRTAMIFGSGDRPVNFVAASDVAAVAALAVLDDDPANFIVEVGGPENLTRKEVAAIYGRVSGQTPRLRHLSLGTLRFMSAVMGPFHSGLSDVMAASVAFEHIDQSFDASRAPQRYPLPLTRLEDFVRRQLTGRAEAGATSRATSESRPRSSAASAR